MNLVHALSDEGRRQVGVLLAALSAGLASRRAMGVVGYARGGWAFSGRDGNVRSPLPDGVLPGGVFQPGRWKVDPAGTDGDAGTPAVRVPKHQFYRGVRWPPNDCSMAVSWKSGDWGNSKGSNLPGVLLLNAHGTRSHTGTTCSYLWPNREKEFNYPVAKANPHRTWKLKDAKQNQKLLSGHFHCHG